MAPIGCVRCEKFWCDFMARTSALIAPGHPFCIEFCVVTKHCQMHQNIMKNTKTWVWGLIGKIGCVRCEKFWCDFMPRNCALILLVQPALHRGSCSNETIQNAPKHYKMNISLGSNGVDRVRSGPKIPMRVRATKFCVNCTSSARFAPSFMQLRNKCKMHPNSTKQTNTWV